MREPVPRIQQLPPAIVARIAAGEVIERPASVVKELLENAVDAGGTRIDVDIEHGGVELIRVVDNGCGMHPDDLPLAFASHATSKLADPDDLFRIASLGFRGEALASIAGVAQVMLQSRPGGLDCGAEISCSGGDLAPVRPWGGAPGTRVEVRRLFYNTPVRRKFLRTIPTEVGHVCETFARVALARPNLHLTLRHNGKTVHEVPAAAGLSDRIVLFLGSELRQRLLPVEVVSRSIALTGFIGDPAVHRGNARGQYFFVNGRWVRDRSVAHALQEAYRGLLMTGRYSVAVLFLELPPDWVDVNVHPTKAEVRFRDSQAVYHLVFTAVRDRLRGADLTATLTPPVPEAAFPRTRLSAPPVAAAPGSPTACHTTRPDAVSTGGSPLPSRAVTTADTIPSRRSNSTMRTSSSKRRTACLLSTSTPCTSASSSKN